MWDQCMICTKPMINYDPDGRSDYTCGEWKCDQIWNAIEAVKHASDISEEDRTNFRESLRNTCVDFEQVKRSNELLARLKPYGIYMFREKDCSEEGARPHPKADENGLLFQVFASGSEDAHEKGRTLYQIMVECDDWEDGTKFDGYIQEMGD